jgi:hypothetical protein
VVLDVFLSLTTFVIATVAGWVGHQAMGTADPNHRFWKYVPVIGRPLSKFRCIAWAIFVIGTSLLTFQIWHNRASSAAISESLSTIRDENQSLKTEVSSLAATLKEQAMLANLQGQLTQQRQQIQQLIESGEAQISLLLSNASTGLQDSLTDLETVETLPLQKLEVPLISLDVARRLISSDSTVAGLEMIQSKNSKELGLLLSEIQEDEQKKSRTIDRARLQSVISMFDSEVKTLEAMNRAVRIRMKISLDPGNGIEPKEH